MKPSRAADAEEVPSGLPELGVVAWGTHICHFYRAAQDLRDVLVPFFRAGLLRNEKCVWVTSEPLPARHARAALARALPDLSVYERQGQIEIHDFDEWYAASSDDDGVGVVQAWTAREREALSQGFTGLRVSGNAFRVERDDWVSFGRYEAMVHSALRDRRILALCSYAVDRCSADDLLDVLRNHGCALVRPGGAWQVVRTATQLLSTVTGAPANDANDVSVCGCRTEVRQGAAAHADGPHADGPHGAGPHAGAIAPRGLRSGQTGRVEPEHAAHHRLSNLQRVTSALSEVQRLSEMIAVVERDLCTVLGATHALVASVDEQRLEEVCRVGWRNPATTAPDLAARVLETGRSFWLHGCDELTTPSPRSSDRACAVAAVALRVAGRQTGVLVLGFPSPQPFDLSQRALVEDVAGQVALCLDRALLYEQVRRQRDRAEHASRAKDEFLAMLGHELRNPLSAIRSAGNLIGLTAPEGDARRAHEVLERQTAHMSRLVDDLLDVSRIAHGKIELAREPIDLALLLARMVRERADEAARRGVVLRALLSDGSLWVRGDEVRLTQVFDNLLSNAFKFTGAAEAIEVCGHAEEGQVVVSVRDTGAGISRGLLPHVFEPFRQATQGLARTAGGLGLGLALARGLVELHGGVIRARSDGPGTGTDVVVRLPACATRHDAPAPRAHGRAASARVLIVEDSADVADLLRAILERRGHAVSVAYDGDAALEVAAAFLPEVVLCDIGLPGTRDGYDVAHALRGDPALKNAFLVAVTGYGRREDVARARTAGFDAHLTKPVDLATVEHILATRPGQPAP